MRRRIHEGEQYPFYSLGLPANGVRLAIDVSDEDFADYQRVMGEFEAWQGRLSAAAQDAHDHRWLDQTKLQDDFESYVCAGCGKRKHEPR